MKMGYIGESSTFPIFSPDPSIPSAATLALDEEQRALHAAAVKAFAISAVAVTALVGGGLYLLFRKRK